MERPKQSRPEYGHLGVRRRALPGATKLQQSCLAQWARSFAVGGRENMERRLYFLLSLLNVSGVAVITVLLGSTECVNQTLPPMMQPSPMVVSPPRIVAPE